MPGVVDLIRSGGKKILDLSFFALSIDPKFFVMELVFFALPTLAKKVARKKPLLSAPQSGDFLIENF